MQTEEELEDRLSCPTQQVVESMRALDGNLILLGAGGKMGPSMARMARRACDQASVARRVLAVSRFTDRACRDHLEAAGVETLACDLLDRHDVARLPRVANVLYMVGMKFGTTRQASLTWAMNTVVPAQVCEHFADSRIVAFSTGNVYGLSPIDRGGSVESDPLAPVGEYAMSCVGRERVLEYFSQRLAIPMVLVRLNYACELRYGVLVDIAQRVWQQLPIDLSMGYLNCIWQADANALTLGLFERATSPARVLNLTGPEILSVRELAESFGQRMNKSPVFHGTEAATALLSNAAEVFSQVGQPEVSVEQMLDSIAAWVMQGGRLLGKPTHFESRSGRF